MVGSVVGSFEGDGVVGLSVGVCVGLYVSDSDGGVVDGEFVGSDVGIEQPLESNTPPSLMNI